MSFAEGCSGEGLKQTTFGDTYKVLSYGGGVDSMGMLVLAIEKGALPDLVVFADVGDPEHLDPAEWPATYRHIHEVVLPLCEKHGIEFKWLGTDESPIRGERSLFAYFEKNALMPGRTSRLCTSAAKVERIRDFLAEHVPSCVTRLEVQIGFEAGEEKRLANDPHAEGSGATFTLRKAHAQLGGCEAARCSEPVCQYVPGTTWGRVSDVGLCRSHFGNVRRVNVFPLMAAGICRCRSIELIRSHGYEVPNGSACMFCPFSKWDDFKRAQDQLPEHFARTQQLEDNCRKTKSGKTMRFDYAKGDGSDRRLTDRVRLPYVRQTKPCDVCGRAQKAQKKTSCEPIDQFPGGV